MEKSFKRSNFLALRCVDYADYKLNSFATKIIL